MVHELWRFPCRETVLWASQLVYNLSSQILCRSLWNFLLDSFVFFALVHQYLIHNLCVKWNIYFQLIISLVVGAVSLSSKISENILVITVLAGPLPVSRIYYFKFVLTIMSLLRHYFVILFSMIVLVYAVENMISMQESP